jgi:hypothetical protein
MEGMRNIVQTIGTMPLPALAALVVLAGFALAAYAIHAVVSTSGKGGRKCR